MADTSKEEAEIDRLVYQLYGLTEDEIISTLRAIRNVRVYQLSSLQVMILGTSAT